MQIKSLKIENFKNFEEATFNFKGSMTGFCGPNGSGKTNLLDAIHYISLGRSYINNVDRQNIRDGAEYFALIADLTDKNGNETELRIAYSPSRKKKITKNGVPYEKLIEHIGFLPVIMITPFDLPLITGSREERRRFLDKVISQISPDYLNALVYYNRALEQRNHFLKQCKGSLPRDREMTSVYDSQLIQYGKVLFEHRKKFVGEFGPIFNEFYQAIAGTDEPVGIKYQSRLLSNDFAELLQSSISDDVQWQRTTRGPHRDEVEFSIFDKPVKKFASQGQQKTFLFSLKLALNDIFRDKKGFPPLLLLDDIGDRLDNNRLSKLAELVLSGNFGQTFMTDTESSRIKKYFRNTDSEAEIFNILNGKVTGN